MAIQIVSACGEQDAVSDELGRNVARISDSSNEVATGADHTAKACLELTSWWRVCARAWGASAWPDGGRSQ